MLPRLPLWMLTLVSTGVAMGAAELSTLLERAAAPFDRNVMRTFTTQMMAARSSAR